MTNRTPNLLVTAGGSTVVHAATALTGRLACYQVIACTGRSVVGRTFGSGSVDAVTCSTCLKALASGRAVWTGQ